MNESAALNTDEMTEEQAKAEIERLTREIQFLLRQIDRDYELGQQIKARTDATMARVHEALARLESSR